MADSTLVHIIVGGRTAAGVDDSNLVVAMSTANKITNTYTSRPFDGLFFDRLKVRL
jgi:hypothetical protein